VEEKSRPPSELSIRFLYQGGQTDIVAVDVATVSNKQFILPGRCSKQGLRTGASEATLQFARRRLVDVVAGVVFLSLARRWGRPTGGS